MEDDNLTQENGLRFTTTPEVPTKVVEALSIAQQDDRAGGRLKAFTCLGSEQLGDNGDMNYWLLCKATVISPNESGNKMVTVLLNVPANDERGIKPEISAMDEVHVPSVPATE